MDRAEANSIRVVVRIRPFNSRELAETGGSVSAVHCESSTVFINEGSSSSTSSKAFSYDHVFSQQHSQQDVFDAAGMRLLENALDAYNGCVFAYGQTGAGKTHSMVGDMSAGSEQGLLPRACSRLFEMIAGRCHKDASFQATVLASYLEIYNEKIFDLVAAGGSSRGELQIRLHPQLGAIVSGLTECPVKTFGEIDELLNFGAKRRATGATQMNATSSRSHAVFTIQIRMVVTKPGSSVESQARIHFVDLAGSERQKKTGAAGDRLREGIGINQSLSTLGRVISELTKPSSRSMPAFRDSKLTLLLKDALMGNSRTEMLACISPSSFNLEETISTLEFASRCKLVKTSASRNEQSKTDVIARLTDEKAAIENQLQQEKATREALQRQLFEEISKAAEKKHAMDTVLQEKRDIDEKLKKLRTTKQVGAPYGTALQDVISIKSIGERAVVLLKSGDLCGVIRYLGLLEGQDGEFIGLELDEEKGKNDGSLKGTQYFSCAPGHGLFARPDMVRSLGLYHPGSFRVLQQTTLAGQCDTAANVSKGMVVQVEEIQYKHEDHSVWGRLRDPAGWVQLCNCQTREQWLHPTAAESICTEDVGALQRRLHDLDLLESQQREKTRQEQDLRTSLEQEFTRQQERETEMLSQIEALRGVQESFALSQTQWEQKRAQLQQQRGEELSQLGMDVSGIDMADISKVPKLVNLHPDPSLQGTLVYYLPLGETHIGSDRQRCRVALTGLSVSSEVCKVSNQDNQQLFVQPCGDGLVRVNGRAVANAETGDALHNGDRLAIGRAYIFQVLIPEDTGAISEAQEDDFARAMEEISAGAEVDPQWENSIQKAMLLVKSDFGTEAANKLLVQAKQASEACVMANMCLQQMPRHRTGGVHTFELSILFDAHGLPQVCVVARREATQAASKEAEGFRGGGPAAGIWTIEQFWSERLPAIYEALNITGLQQQGTPETENAAGLWETHVWSELSLETCRTLIEENQMLRGKVQAMETQGASGSRRGDFAGWVQGSISGVWTSAKSLSSAIGATLRSRSSSRPTGRRMNADLSSPQRRS